MKKAVIIFFLFSLCRIYSTAEYIEYEEAHQQVGEVMYGVKLEAHHHVMKREADQPIRLNFYFDPSVDSALPSIIRTSIIPAIKQNLESLLMVRRTNVPILLNRECTNRSFFPTSLNETRRCNTTCANQTICGATVVPEEHLRACMQCDGDISTCETIGENGEGVTGTDLVIYVSGIDVLGLCVTTSGVAAMSTLAFAAPCQLESGLDRPIAAGINFCPSAITRFNSNTIYHTALHEIIHTLGFSRVLYPFWRNEQGQPRTERDEFGLPPVIIVNGQRQLAWSNATITTVTYDDWETFNGNVSHTVNIMVTPAVVEYGRRHFNCPTLLGVELENQGGPATELSHWEKRILGNELMTGIIEAQPVLSNLTLGLLEDSGWYKVNFTKGQTLDWGYSSGCTFASRSCFQFMQQQNNDQRPITPFCFTSPSLGNNQFMTGCTVDRKYSSLCNIAQYINPVPIDYQYFNSPIFGGIVLIADYCPFNAEINFNNGQSSFCSNATNQPANNLLGQTFGTGSACFNQPNNNWTFNNTLSTLRGSGCYLYTCNNDSTQLTIFVQGFPYACQQPGQILTVSNNGHRGELACPVVPSFARLCEEAIKIPIVVPSVTPSVVTSITPSIMPSSTPDVPDTSAINMIAITVLLVSLFVALILSA